MILRTASIQCRPPELLDITRKTSGPAGRPFAPSPGILWPIIDKRHRGTLTSRDYSDYRAAYIREMGDSYKRNRAAWAALLEREEVTLGCYCHRPEDASHCHRVVLAWLLLQAASRLGSRVQYLGEWGKSPRVAVVGARRHPHAFAWAAAVVAQIPTGGVVVSGHAVGVDAAAELAAVRAGLQLVSLPCSGHMWEALGRGAGQVRNGWISAACDAVVALPWDDSPGTIGMMDIAGGDGKPVYVVRSEEDLADAGGFIRKIGTGPRQEGFRF